MSETTAQGWREQQRIQDEARRAEVMDLPVIEARPHGVIAGPDDDVRVCASIGPAGELVAVWVAPDDLDAASAKTLSPGGASFPDPGAARPVPARITVHAPRLAAVVQIPALTLAHITVQPMPGNRFLIAGARCRWHPDGPDRNAVLYDARGQVLSEHVLGDGLAQVQASSTGEIWAGYFDEGIYGNYGWSEHDTQLPIGRYGIMQFSPDLEPAWHPDYDAIRPWGVIDECSALNVSDTGTWLSYDADYPVVRIQDGTVTGWHNDVKGIRALAVVGSRVTLFGGGRADRDRLAIAELTGDRARLDCEYRIVLADGQSLEPGIEVIGRGPHLHFLTDIGWYQLDISDLTG